MSSSRLHTHGREPISRRRRVAARNLANGLTLAVVALALAPAGAAAQAAAPLTGTGQRGAIRDQYIVVMKSAASAAAKERTKNRARARGGRVDRNFRSALKAYAAVLPPAALAEVRGDPEVAYVEADAVVSASATQTSAPWGLDRIDQSSLPLSGSYSYAAAGTAVTAYIIDTGIRFGHAQFGGRAVSGYDAIDGGSADDCNGHGTHVAGSVGGSTYGVAKQVGLVGVRVLDCAGSGTTSGVIAGIDWITSDHAAGEPAVANMSLGGDASRALDTAVQNSINDGISYAVAAGNENTDACLGSPARVANALTVASTTATDARSSFSNFGSCVDLFAPGSSIISSWYSSDTTTKTISGTSMATPHVAGVAALYLQDDPAATPSTVAGVVIDGATTGMITNAGTGSPNRLLQTVTAEPADTSAPETLLGSGPSGTTASSSVSFAFSSSEAASAFECRLDGPGAAAGAYGACSSPTSYAGLADGSYTFSVRATDAAGNIDASAASSTFTVDTVAPQTSIGSGPSGTTASSSVSFAFSSSEAASAFECRLDGPGAAAGAYGACSSPTSYAGLADGSYTFSVRATDAAGNIDASAASSTFTVEVARPAPAIAPAPEPAPASSPPPAPAPAPAPVAPPAPAPPAGTADGGAPLARFTASRLQKLAKQLRVSVYCPRETCVAGVSGSVSVPKVGSGRARVFKLKKISTVIAKGGKATLRPRLSYAARVAIGRALGRGRRITVKITITARSAGGSTQTLTRRVQLKR